MKIEEIIKAKEEAKELERKAKEEDYILNKIYIGIFGKTAKQLRNHYWNDRGRMPDLSYFFTKEEQDVFEKVKKDVVLLREHLPLNKAIKKALMPFSRCKKYMIKDKEKEEQERKEYFLQREKRGL